MGLEGLGAWFMGLEGGGAWLIWGLGEGGLDVV